MLYTYIPDDLCVSAHVSRGGHLVYMCRFMAWLVVVGNALQTATSRLARGAVKLSNPCGMRQRGCSVRASRDLHGSLLLNSSPLKMSWVRPPSDVSKIVFKEAQRAELFLDECSPLSPDFCSEVGSAL